VNGQSQSHLFWGTNSPLSSLTGVALLIIASGRIAFALIALLNLLFVYAFTLITVKIGMPAFPEQGQKTVLLFIASLFSSFYFILLWIINPALTMESSLIVLLAPAVFVTSGLCERVVEYDMLEIISQAIAESFIMGMLILGIALIREPLGFGSISIPGFDIVRFVKEEPLRFFQSSAGALVILGYGIAVYRHFRNQYTNSEDD
jgi:hypothetical protein